MARSNASTLSIIDRKLWHDTDNDIKRPQNIKPPAPTIENDPIIQAMKCKGEFFLNNIVAGTYMTSTWTGDIASLRERGFSVTVTKVVSIHQGVLTDVIHSMGLSNFYYVQIESQVCSNSMAIS